MDAEPYPSGGAIVYPLWHTHSTQRDKPSHSGGSTQLRSSYTSRPCCGACSHFQAKAGHSPALDCSSFQPEFFVLLVNEAVIEGGFSFGEFGTQVGGVVVL